MKNLITLIVGLLITNAVLTQNEEFRVYSNGLIYSEHSMGKLAKVVDSLNLKFKTCDFDKIFLARQQVIGHMVKLDSGDIQSAITDLEKNISFENFCFKYPSAKIDKNILIIKSQYTNYDNQEIVVFNHFNLKNDYGFKIQTEDLSLYQKDMKQEWIYEYTAKSEYSKESITGFYFPENFESRELPKKYSLMVGYTDCLIDTTSTKLNENSKSGWVDLPEKWTSLSDKKKDKLLKEMRNTRVIGGCSQDSRPRKHAINIALLSAETYNWEVFLKAHLDIMNDRFERMSDGSYAWAQRNTYIKELEELNINVADLLLGISLRIENPANNHYYGSIGRIGRALSETNNKSEIETTMLAIVADTELDYYNRLLFYFLFKNYNYHLKDELAQINNSEKLRLAATTFPDFMSEKLNEKTN